MLAVMRDVAVRSSAQELLGDAMAMLGDGVRMYDTPCTEFAASWYEWQNASARKAFIEAVRRQMTANRYPRAYQPMLIGIIVEGLADIRIGANDHELLYLTDFLEPEWGPYGPSFQWTRDAWLTPEADRVAVEASLWDTIRDGTSVTRGIALRMLWYVDLAIAKSIFDRLDSPTFEMTEDELKIVQSIHARRVLGMRH